MSAAAFVDHAALVASKMIAREARGPGDIENAMRRIEARYAIPYSVLWALRYRRPKQIAASAFAGIQRAYDLECERQIKLIEHERAITQAKSGFAAALVRAADALVGEGD
jgi:hypothetical protein